jgi:hypothetical protein
MASSMARLLVALVLATVIAAGLPASVGAWSSSCGTTNGACIYAHQNFTLPRAGASTSVEVYVGKYFNSDINLNDSASSLKNLFTNRDIRWYHDPSWGGFSWCIDSNTMVGDLGWLDNDAFSSHIKYGHDAAC